MRTHVWTDEVLRKHAGRFVWLSVDTQAEGNLPFLERFPDDELPSYWIIDPKGEHAVLRWAGSLTVDGIERLLDAGEAALHRARVDALEEALRAAEALHAARRHTEAAPALAALLERAPTDWAQRGRTLELLVTALQASGAAEACAERARQHLPAQAHDQSFVKVATRGIACARAAGSAGVAAELERLGRVGLGVSTLTDDLSDLYAVLIAARRDAGDIEGAEALARRWLALLEAARKAAPTAVARAAFDPHLALAAVEAREQPRVIPALEQSERDLVSDYEASARLAMLYASVRRDQDALAAVDRAMARVYGPRRIRVLLLRSRLLREAGQLEAARAAFEQAAKLAEAVPPAQRRRQWLDEVETERRGAQSGP